MLLAFIMFLLLFTIDNCTSQIPRVGPCMEMERSPNYDPTKILGRWYRYGAYPSCSADGRCRKTLFISDNDGSMTIIEKRLSTLPDELPIVNKVSTVKYLADASYLVTYPTDDSLFNQTLTFWNTDYTSYAIKGICVNIEQASMQYAWILTREPHPSSSVIARINEAIKVDGLRPEFFRKENQTDCPSDY